MLISPRNYRNDLYVPFLQFVHLHLGYLTIFMEFFLGFNCAFGFKRFSRVVYLDAALSVENQDISEYRVLLSFFFHFSWWLVIANG